MPSRINQRRNLLVVLSTLALLTTVLAVAPAAASGTQCGPQVQKHDGAWTVYPNGSNDTDALACAIAEASAYSRSGSPTVHLAEGTFYSDFLDIDGFTGRIRGSGRDATIIEPLEGGLDCIAEVEATGFAVWMTFVGSNLIMKDLTLSIPEVACAEPWESFIDVDPDTGEEVGFVAEDFNVMVGLINRISGESQCEVRGYSSLKVKRVNVDAPQPNFGEPIFNPKGAFNAFFIGGSQPEGCEVPDEPVGNVFVRDTHASDVGNLIEARSVTDSLIKVARNHTVGVDAAVILAGNERSVAKVHSNTIEGSTGVGIVSDNCLGPENPALCVADYSKVKVFKNDIHMSEIGFAGVLAFGGTFAAPAVHTRIVNNRISGEGNVAGVLIENVDGDLVYGNSFGDASVFAVLAEGTTTNSKIVRNDMTEYTAFEAGILLGELTSLNRVKHNLGATVVDLGTGNIVNAGAPGLGPATLSSDWAAVPSPESNRYRSWATR
jgi:hypothetical protein